MVNCVIYFKTKETTVYNSNSSIQSMLNVIGQLEPSNWWSLTSMWSAQNTQNLIELPFS
jgi:hypothetical protein